MLGFFLKKISIRTTPKTSRKFGDYFIEKKNKIMTKIRTIQHPVIKQGFFFLNETFLITSH